MLHDGDRSCGILEPSRLLCHNYTLLACYQTLAHRRLAPNLHTMMTPPPSMGYTLGEYAVCGLADTANRQRSWLPCTTQARPTPAQPMPTCYGKRPSGWGTHPPPGGGPAVC